MVNTWSHLNRLCCKGFVSLVDYLICKNYWGNDFTFLHFIVEAVVFMSQQPCGLADSLSLRETFNNHYLKKLSTKNLILSKDMSMFIVRFVWKTPFSALSKIKGWGGQAWECREHHLLTRDSEGWSISKTFTERQVYQKSIVHLTRGAFLSLIPKKKDVKRVWNVAMTIAS